MKNLKVGMTTFSLFFCARKKRNRIRNRPQTKQSIESSFVSHFRISRISGFLDFSWISRFQFCDGVPVSSHRYWLDSSTPAHFTSHTTFWCPHTQPRGSARCGPHPRAIPRFARVRKLTSANLSPDSVVKRYFVAL